MNKILSQSFLLRFGLACLFLTNSIVAFLEPAEFQDLVSGSFLVKVIPVSVATFVTFIGINDFIVAMLLLVNWKVSKVAIWASIWIAGVILVGGVFSLDALEHLGFLALALAIVFRGRSK